MFSFGIVRKCWHQPVLEQHQLGLPIAKAPDVFTEIYPAGWPLTLLQSQHTLALLLATLLAAFILHRSIRRWRLQLSFARLRAAGQMLKNTLVRSHVAPAPHSWFQEQARNLPGPVACAVCTNSIEKGRERMVPGTSPVAGTPVLESKLARGHASSLSLVATSGWLRADSTDAGSLSAVRSDPSLTEGVVAAMGGIERCSVCGVTAHGECVPQARQDCKRVSVPPGTRELPHHWVEMSLKRIAEDLNEDDLACMLCDQEVCALVLLLLLQVQQFVREHGHAISWVSCN